MEQLADPAPDRPSMGCDPGPDMVQRRPTGAGAVSSIVSQTADWHPVGIYIRAVLGPWTLILLVAVEAARQDEGQGDQREKSGGNLTHPGTSGRLFGEDGQSHRGPQHHSAAGAHSLLAVPRVVFLSCR
jgi:hypothetical protein